MKGLRTKELLTMKRILIVVALGMVLFSGMMSTAAATDAMKPGHGHGDANHVHYGAPGRMR